MNRIVFSVVSLSAVLALSACSSLEKDLKESGAKPMTKGEIKTLYADKTVNGVSENGSNWVVYFDPSGEVRGRSNWSGGSDKDSGTWQATEDDMICIQFRKWQNGRLRCWQLYLVDGKLTYIGRKGGAETQEDDDTWVEGNVENL